MVLNAVVFWLAFKYALNGKKLNIWITYVSSTAGGWKAFNGQAS
jgi:hypothetical protein